MFGVLNLSPVQLEVVTNAVDEAMNGYGQSLYFDKEGSLLKTKGGIPLT